MAEFNFEVEDEEEEDPDEIEPICHGTTNGHDPIEMDHVTKESEVPYENLDNIWICPTCGAIFNPKRYND